MTSQRQKQPRDDECAIHYRKYGNPNEWGDEMPAALVTNIATHLTHHSWTVTDAHESAIVIQLTPAARTTLDADDTDRVFVIGWTQNGGFDWGLSPDGGHVPNPQWLGGNPSNPKEIADRAHRTLNTGSPDLNSL